MVDHKRALTQWIGIVLLSALSVTATANEPLPGDMIQDLNRLQSQLASQTSGSADPDVLNSIIAHARAQSERLAGGNRADQWASALYHQLTASALVRQGYPPGCCRRACQCPSAAKRPPIVKCVAGYVTKRRCAVPQENGGQAITLYEQWLNESSGSDRYAETAWQLVRLLAEEERWQEAMEWLAPLLEQGGVDG